MLDLLDQLLQVVLEERNLGVLEVVVLDVFLVEVDHRLLHVLRAQVLDSLQVEMDSVLSFDCRLVPEVVHHVLFPVAHSDVVVKGAVLDVLSDHVLLLGGVQLEHFADFIDELIVELLDQCSDDRFHVDQALVVVLVRVDHQELEELRLSVVDDIIDIILHVEIRLTHESETEDFWVFVSMQRDQTLPNPLELCVKLFEVGVVESENVELAGFVEVVGSVVVGVEVVTELDVRIEDFGEVSQDGVVIHDVFKQSEVGGGQLGEELLLNRVSIEPVVPHDLVDHLELRPALLEEVGHESGFDVPEEDVLEDCLEVQLVVSDLVCDGLLDREEEFRVLQVVFVDQQVCAFHFLALQDFFGDLGEDDSEVVEDFDRVSEPELLREHVDVVLHVGEEVLAVVRDLPARHSAEDLRELLLLVRQQALQAADERLGVLFFEDFRQGDYQHVVEEMPDDQVDVESREDVLAAFVLEGLDDCLDSDLVELDRGDFQTGFVHHDVRVVDRHFVFVGFLDQEVEFFQRLEVVVAFALHRGVVLSSDREAALWTRPGDHRIAAVADGVDVVAGALVDTEVRDVCASVVLVRAVCQPLDDDVFEDTAVVGYLVGAHDGGFEGLVFVVLLDPVPVEAEVVADFFLEADRNEEELEEDFLESGFVVDVFVSFFSQELLEVELVSFDDGDEEGFVQRSHLYGGDGFGEEVLDVEDEVGVFFADWVDELVEQDHSDDVVVELEAALVRLVDQIADLVELVVVGVVAHLVVGVDVEVLDLFSEEHDAARGVLVHDQA